MWRARLLVIGLMLLSVHVGLSHGTEKPTPSETKKRTPAAQEKITQAEPAKSLPARRRPPTRFKAFTPSEKIKADQTVDFPTDI